MIRAMWNKQALQKNLKSSTMNNQTRNKIGGDFFYPFAIWRTNMNYIKITIHTKEAGIEPIITELMWCDVTDVVIDDPRDIDDLINKEHDYEWDYIDDAVMDLKNQEPKVTIYLEDTPENLVKTKEVEEAMDKLLAKVKDGQFGENIDFGSLKVDIVMENDEGWKDNWKEFFKPAKISNSIVVKPSWENYSQNEGELVIELDPGMAFGTGTHETTSLCVKMMEEYMKPGDSVLDVGCGSGILSIAAALLGSTKVLGVEIDPVAVEIAKENLILNRVDNVAKAQFGDLTKGIDFKANLVVANLMADLVIMLSKDVAKHLLPDGIYISSGILVEKEVKVADEIRACGFKILEVKEDGMWCCIVAQK